MVPRRQAAHQRGSDSTNTLGSGREVFGAHFAGGAVVVRLFTFNKVK